MKKTIHILIFAIVISAVSGFGTVGLSNDIFIKYGEKVLIKFKQLEQAEELLVLAPLPENAVAENVNIIKSNFFEDSEFILPDGTKPVGDCDLVEYNGERYIKIKSLANGVGKYSTSIDNLVTEIAQAGLPPSVSSTFTDGIYRTVTTNQKVTLYRGFGAPNGYLNGGYSTTIKNATRNELAILDEWGNSLRFEAKIEVPNGQTLNVGKVEKQISSNGLQTLDGGADQVLLPQNWNSQSWVKEVVDTQTGIKYTYSEFVQAFPNVISK